MKRSRKPWVTARDHRYALPTLIGAVAGIVLLAIVVSAVVQSGGGARVVPLGEPDRGATLVRILSSSANYLIPQVSTFYEPDGLRIDRGAEDDPTDFLRGASAVALAHAAGLRGAYEGVDSDTAREQAVRIIDGVSRYHKANGGSYGYSWQSQIPAAHTGLAAWLLWDELDAKTQLDVENMVSAEANYTADLQIEYYRDGTGTVIRPGNSASEEEAWRSRILSLAYAMMPEAAEAERWKSAFVSRHLAAFSTPGDTRSREDVHGHPLSEWISGSNLQPNGDVVNRGMIHPTYMRTPHSITNIVQQGLAGQPLSPAHTHNLGLVYRALTEYYRGPDEVIYPGTESNARSSTESDLGRSQLPLFYAHDVTMRALGIPGAAGWERIHGEEVEERQLALDTGQVYRPGDFDRPYVEHDAAAKFAEAWLLLAAEKPELANDPLEPLYPR